MAADVSPGTIRRIAALFPEPQRSEVTQLLVSLCGDNLPFAETLGPAGLERVRFGILKISGGSLDRLWSAVELAQSDWRDVLVGAGFDKDERSHLRWLADA
jgi:hypothetical protein